MAMLYKSSNKNSSSKNYRKTPSPTRGSNTQASAYLVDASSMELKGLHFSASTPGAGGAEWRRRRALVRKRSGDAAHHITEESERLFCDALRAVFLVEKDTGLRGSLVVDVRNNHSSNVSGNVVTSTVGRDPGAVEIPQRQQHTILKHDLPTPSPSPDERSYPAHEGMVREYVEVWDYAGGARFRGFVAEKDGERALFIFFDREVLDKDLKPGVMALLELASTSTLDCSQLVVCVDRTADNEESATVTRDLGWVGFELMMLDSWAGESNCISDRWVFLSVDL